MSFRQYISQILKYFFANLICAYQKNWIDACWIFLFFLEKSGDLFLEINVNILFIPFDEK